MKLLPLVLCAVLLVPAVSASDVEYLVPIGPSTSIDAYGARWQAALIGYNFSRADVLAETDPPCRPFHAQEAVYCRSFSPNAAPSVLRIPSDRVQDLVLEETVNVIDPSMIQRPSHGFRLPLIRLDSLAAGPLQFLHVAPITFHSRTHLRVFSPLGNDATRTVGVSIFREQEGRSSPIFFREYTMSETVTNGVRVGHAVIEWPNAAERPPFPVRIEVSSDAPIWGFVTVTERSATPAVSVILPAK